MGPTQTSSNLKNDPKSFQNRWISEIRKHLSLYKSGEGSQISAWEGFEACREIADNRLLWCVIPTRGMKEYPAPFLIGKLSREVYLYKLFGNRIVPMNIAFKKAIKVLSGTAAKLKKVAAQDMVIAGGLSGDLEHCCLPIEKAVNRLKVKYEGLWRDSLIATPEEKLSWDLHFAKDGKLFRIPPADLLAEEKRFAQARYPERLLKRIQLDRRFQVRVATILRHYLPKRDGISLKTISRFTVLTYIAGSLGEEREDDLILERRKRPINVVNVDQIIRNAGIK